MTRREALAWLAAASFAPSACRPVEAGRTLRLATWGGAGDDGPFAKLVDSLYREFERAHPGVRLSLEAIPGSQEYVSKLLLDSIAGAMPDIVTLDASSAAVFIDNETLLDLTPFIERDPAFRLEDYFPNTVDIARRAGAVFAVPTDFTPMVVYCNARHFREAGVPLPQGRWTFEEFLEKAIRLSAGGRYGLDFSNWMPGWILFLWNNGADVLAPDGSRAQGFFDSPKAVEAVQFVADLVLKHRVAPSLSQAAATGVDYFATGRAAMKLSGHWSLVDFRASKSLAIADVFVAEVPTNLPRSVTVMYESGQSIGRHCRHPELAWEYLKYWASEAVQSRYNSSGIAVCARRDVAYARAHFSTFTLRPPDMAKAEFDRLKAQGRLEDEAEHEREATFERVIPSARAPWGARVEGYDRVEDIGQKAMDAILKNGAPVAGALAQAAREIDAEFARR